MKPNLLSLAAVVLALSFAPTASFAVIGDVASSECSVDIELDLGILNALVNCEVFSGPSPNNPMPVAGNFTYVYTVTNDANSDFNLEAFAADFVDGAVTNASQVGAFVTSDVTPSAIDIIDTPTEKEVRWRFESPSVAPGQMVELFIISEFAPGTTQITATGEFAVQGSGDGCLGPVNDPPAPSEIQLQGQADTFLRAGVRNTNEGKNEILRLRSDGNNRVLVNFDLSEVPPSASLSRATLVLHINGEKSPSSWGKDFDRTVEAHLLNEPFAEGNGKNAELPGSQKTRGSGAAATWNCGIDTVIQDQNSDCATKWAGGNFAPATAPPVVHFNDRAGDVEWDVTDDIEAVLGGEPFYGFLIKKTNEGKGGNVRYFSREGAAGDTSKEPRLILEFN